jgi:hypothetical protein
VGPGFLVGEQHLAYGEIKAPQQVNTLRTEACPVCGEKAAYDGTSCSVCRFVQPPSQFRDPDLDMAKQIDLRQHDQLGGADVEDMEAQVNDRDGDGLDDKTGEPVGMDEEGNELLGDEPGLGCPACGSEFPAGEPQTTTTTAPTEGDLGAGPAEGDLCPACGKGELMPTGADSGQEVGPDGEPIGQEPGLDGDPDEEEPDEFGDLHPDDPFRQTSAPGEEDPDGEEDPEEEPEDDEEEESPSPKKNKNPFGK